MEMLRASFVSAFQGVMGEIGAVLPKLLGAAFFIIIGLLFASMLARVVRDVLTMAKVNELAKTAKLDSIFGAAGYKLDVAGFVAKILWWFVVVVAFIAAFSALGLDQVNMVLGSILAYFPHFLAAAAILFITALAAQFLSALVGGATHSVGPKVANMLRVLVRWSVVILGVIMALSELQIAESVLMTLFTGVVAALSLAAGLAFGLGGKDAAADLIKEVRDEVREGRRG